MFLKSGVDYYLVNLEGITITCKSGLHIVSPNFKLKLLSYPDINKVETLIKSGTSIYNINEEIVSKYVSIIGFDNEEFDQNESPAWITDHLATKIRLNSNTVLEDLVKTYDSFAMSLNILEKLSMVVAHYTNNTYEYTQQLSIDELVKRYTICATTFPGVSPIESNEEEESKVG